MVTRDSLSDNLAKSSFLKGSESHIPPREREGEIMMGLLEIYDDYHHCEGKPPGSEEERLTKFFEEVGIYSESERKHYLTCYAEVVRMGKPISDEEFMRQCRQFTRSS